MMLAITTHGNPVLTQVAHPVEVFDEALNTLARNMLETMYASRGIGLAAQQIGEKKRICVIDLQHCVEGDEKCTWDGKIIPVRLIGPFVLVNSRITQRDEMEVAAEEGCLSFPGVNGEVWRSQMITATFQDLDGTPHTVSCGGLLARCIQHENDHLDGIVFIQRMEKNVRKGLKAKLHQLEKENEDVVSRDAKHQ